MTSTRTTWDGQPIAEDWPHGVTVVVYRPTPAGLELLLLHRARHGPDYAGDWAWTPPAGCRLPGEGVDVCARRELYEEAGLHVPMRRLDDGGDWAVYLAEADGDTEVTLHDPEHDRFEWVSAHEALRRVRPAVPLATLRDALAALAP